MENKFEFAKSLVYEAAAYIKAHMDEDLAIMAKSSPTDLVTRLDEEVQDLMVGRILENYPCDQIFAEEKNLRHPILEGQVWVIDPIDGTNNFIAQKTDFAIMLAYFEEGQGQFGLIYDVMRDQLYHGGGAFPVCCNERELLAYKERDLQQSLVSMSAGILEQNAWGLADLAAQSLGTRIYGSAGISLAKVLSGQLLLYASQIYPWDYAAASIMGEKLGYEVLTLEGKRPDFASREAVIILPCQKAAEIRNSIKTEES